MVAGAAAAFCISGSLLFDPDPRGTSPHETEEAGWQIIFMPTKKTAIYRTDLLPHRMDPGKEERKVRVLLAARRPSPKAGTMEARRHRPPLEAP